MACIYYRQVFACKHWEATQIGTWKRAAIKNMAAGFSKRGGDPAQVDDAVIDKPHSKIGQLVVERDFFETRLGSLSKDRRQMCIEQNHPRISV